MFFSGIIIDNRSASHEGLRHNFLLEYFPRREVLLMDMSDVLMLMISFGMLIAFIMSENEKK